MRNRCFVIGNGPSLTETLFPEEVIPRPGHLEFGHFDLLKSEDTFAVNKIHLLYPRTAWRPTYYVFYDRSNDTSYKTDMYLHMEEGYPMYVREDIWHIDDPNIYLSHHCNHHDLDNNPTDKWHLDDWDNVDKMGRPIDRKGGKSPALCKMGGSIPASIQLAAFMGYPKIYLIGCDGGLKPHCTTNHFTPDYNHPDSLNAEKADRANRNLEYNHRVAKIECHKMGIEIYNAGIGGELEVYERVEFESLF